MCGGVFFLESGLRVQGLGFGGAAQLAECGGSVFPVILGLEFGVWGLGFAVRCSGKLAECGGVLFLQRSEQKDVSGMPGVKGRETA